MNSDAEVFSWDALPTPDQTGGKPARFAVIGDPIAHSLSPQMHQPALEALGVDASYVRVQVPRGQVAKALDHMQQRGFLGVNITVPHKAEAATACHRLEAVSQQLGVVNTVRFAESGQQIGTSTDGVGFSRAIRQEFGVDPGDLRVVVIGAGGGAGQAIARQAAQEGAQPLVLANRTAAKLQLLREQLLPHLPPSERLQGPGDTLRFLPLDHPDLEEAVRQSELIVQTTSLGLQATDPPPFPITWIEPHHLVYDTIYNPARTPLLHQATQRGARVANGLSMLLWQGALSLEYWLGREAPLDAMRRGLAAAIHSP